MHARGLEHVYETVDLSNFERLGSFVRDRWEKLGLWETFKQDSRERSEIGGAMADHFMVRPSPLPVDEHVDSCIGRKAVEFVQAYEDTRPLCLFVGFVGPHAPRWDAAGQYATMYDPDETPRAIPIPEAHESLPDYVRGKRDFKVLPPAVMETIPEIRANYYGKISLIDTWFGHILDAFQSRGWLDDLLVVYMSDHGEMAGDHGRLDQSTLHESSLRVPLVLRWPGRIPANTTTSALVENIDVFPTLLEATGSEPSGRALGSSLWPVMRDPQAELREYQLSEIYGSKLFGERRMMVRSHRHKYAIDDAGRGFMLYDLQEDPEEQHNLIGREGMASLEQDMREVLLKRLVASQYSLKPASER
jgi:arylsulfatase A-like enzyme